MEKLNEYLQSLLSTSSYELRLEPNKNPYLLSAGGSTELGSVPLQGPQISMMVYPLIPAEEKLELPNKSEVQFVHPHNLGKFSFVVQKSPAGFHVTVRPVLGELPGSTPPSTPATDYSPVPEPPMPYSLETFAVSASDPVVSFENEPSTASGYELFAAPSEPAFKQASAPLATLDPEFPPIAFDTTDEGTGRLPSEIKKSGYIPPAEEYVPETPKAEEIPAPPLQEQPLQAAIVDRRVSERRKQNTVMQSRMEALLRVMSEAGASNLHLSVGMPPMIRRDGRLQKLECGEEAIPEELMRELLTSIMPEKNRDEFARLSDTDFAYEIIGLARYNCNIFMDRRGMGGVFKIVPEKLPTAQELGLSPAALDLCGLRQGFVVVTGPSGSGRSTVLAAMVDQINRNREEHIVTIEEPIGYVHENLKSLVNQREVHNHTATFRDALAAALREDPDVLVIDPVRDPETLFAALQAAESGCLVLGTMNSPSAVSTVNRIVEQFPADRHQQIRVMLSESLKGVIAQTLVPKKEGGRVAAREVLIVTPSIREVIRDGNTAQIPLAMQSGRTQGMVMLNEALFELVEKGVVELRDAYLKAADKTAFESMLTRSGLEV